MKTISCWRSIVGGEIAAGGIIYEKIKGEETTAIEEGGWSC